MSRTTLLNKEKQQSTIYHLINENGHIYLINWAHTTKSLLGAITTNISIILTVKWCAISLHSTVFFTFTLEWGTGFSQTCWFSQRTIFGFFCSCKSLPDWVSSFFFNQQLLKFHYGGCDPTNIISFLLFTLC